MPMLCDRGPKNSKDRMKELSAMQLTANDSCTRRTMHVSTDSEQLKLSNSMKKSKNNQGKEKKSDATQNCKEPT